MGKGLARFVNRGKLLHLEPSFTTYRGRNSETTPDIVLASNRTTHNVQIEPGPLTTSDHIPITVTITAKASNEPTEGTLNINEAH